MKMYLYVQENAVVIETNGVFVAKLDDRIGTGATRNEALYELRIEFEMGMAA